MIGVEASKGFGRSQERKNLLTESISEVRLRCPFV